VTANASHQFGTVAGAAFAEAVGFDVLVEQLIRIELRAIPGRADRGSRTFRAEGNGSSTASQQAGSVPRDQDGLDSAALMGRATHASVALVVSGLATVSA
jgi:hypothetical protein